jgi:putative acetyltransferase
VHALDHDGLEDPTVTFFGARRDGVLLGIGALEQLDETHGELKSMHTAEEARGQGIGRAMVEHLVGEARRRGYRRLSLETGATAPFVPALTLYERAGFTRCERFGDYPPDRDNTFMTLELDA